MSRPRRYAYRRMDATERTFIETRLARGHSPAAIRDAMNELTRMRPEQIREAVEVGRISGGPRRTIWDRLSGRPDYTIEDVRRVYDAMRKEAFRGRRAGAAASARQSAYIENDDIRRTNVGWIRDMDDRRLALAQFGGPRPWTKGRTRQLADAGMLYRLTADPEALALLKDEYSDI